MPLIQVPKSVTPCQVDMPDSVKDRSCPGSLHFKPGVKRVTQEEWDHVKKALPAMAAKCRVVPVDETKTKGALQKAKEAKEAEKDAPKAVLAKRAKDAPTKRQRRLMELEAKKAGSSAPAVKKMAEAKPAEPPKDKPATDKKTKDK